jgi:hypothetical protein
MGSDIAMGAILVAVAVGFWLTRRSKGADRLPGMAAKDGALDARLGQYEHDEAFEDDKPRDY